MDNVFFIKNEVFNRSKQNNTLSKQNNTHSLILCVAQNAKSGSAFSVYKRIKRIFVAFMRLMRLKAYCINYAICYKNVISPQPWRNRQHGGVIAYILS